jgi:hypothetical protein
VGQTVQPQAAHQNLQLALLMQNQVVVQPLNLVHLIKNQFCDLHLRHRLDLQLGFFL